MTLRSSQPPATPTGMPPMEYRRFGKTGEEISVITLGSYIQSSIGFGLAIIAAPVLFFLDPAYVPAPITVCAFALSLVNAWGHRESVSLRGLKYAVIGRVPGSLAGALLIVGAVLLALGVSTQKSLLFTPTNLTHFSQNNFTKINFNFISNFMYSYLCFLI